MRQDEVGGALGANYRLVRHIGDGATSDVWLAADARTGEDVAAKLLRPELTADHDVVARFVTERSVLTELRHPNIVSVRDLVVEGDRIAIIVDYAPGGSLRDLLKREGTLSPSVAVALAVAILHGLTAAHEREVIHRDVKPDNVLLRSRALADGAGEPVAPGAVQLTDFGIARLLERPSAHTTGFTGTPEYMPPELISGGISGKAGDVYSTGIVLYELLAGRTPFAGPGNMFALAQRHIAAAAPTLPVPAQLWAQIMGMLDKNPDARPTAAAAAAGLQRIAGSLRRAPALPASSAPESFDAGAPAHTAHRSGRGTVHRSGPNMAQRPARDTIHRLLPGRQLGPGAPTPAPTPRRRIALTTVGVIGGTALLAAIAAVVGVAVWITSALGDRAGPSDQTRQASSASISAAQQDQPTPTGLTVARAASWDPAERQATITLTYTAQTAALSGPFLEVLPGVGDVGDCPAIAWSGGMQQRNLPSITGIVDPCGWAVDPGVVPAQGSRTVLATLNLPFAADEAEEALQAWLERATRATAAALSDSSIASTAYPVQRLRDIRVDTPPTIVTESALPITLIPIWPSGPDPLNPLMQTAQVGAPSSLLAAISGGAEGVRFSDRCGGAVAVSADGRNVSTLSQTSSCVIGAHVGNFADLTSRPFAIVNRGG